jgi:hypothetical protein
MEPQTNTISLLLSLSFVSASFMDLVESIIKSAYESQIGVAIVAKNNRYRQVVYPNKGFFANDTACSCYQGRGGVWRDVQRNDLVCSRGIEQQILFSF